MKSSFVLVCRFVSSYILVLCRLPVGDYGLLGCERRDWNHLRFKEIKLHFFSSFRPDFVPPQVCFEERSLNDEMKELGQHPLVNGLINRKVTRHRDIFPIWRNNANRTILEVNLSHYNITRSGEPKIHRIFSVSRNFSFGNRAVKMD